MMSQLRRSLFSKALFPPQNHSLRKNITGGKIQPHTSKLFFESFRERVPIIGKAYRSTIETLVDPLVILAPTPIAGNRWVLFDLLKKYPPATN